MSNEIIIHPKYQPLFELLQGSYPAVDTVIITGGRGSAKSYTIGLWASIALVNHEYSVLFTRYTGASIVDSIKPSVDNKIKQLGFETFVKNTNTHVFYKEERIAFKGMKAGSLEQTGNLKSLEEFNAFVVDEADEMPSFDSFERVFLSIRSNKKRNITILSLNPSSVQNWIFKQFFKPNNLRGGENCIIDNVMYIHTSYLDVPKEYIAQNIRAYYEKMKIKDPKRYDHIVGGEWIKEVEGQVFKDWKEITLDTYYSIDCKENCAVDFGASDPTAILNWKFEVLDNGEQNLYLKEIFYKSENDVISELDNNINYKKEDGSILLYIFNLIAHDKKRFTICDTGGSSQNYSSNNFKIATLLQNGYNVVPALKAPNSIQLGIDLLKSINVFYIGDNIDFEVNNYTNATDREGFIDGKYIDKHNHMIDNARNVAIYLYKSCLLQINT